MCDIKSYMYLKWKEFYVYVKLGRCSTASLVWQQPTRLLPLQQPVTQTTSSSAIATSQ